MWLFLSLAAAGLTSTESALSKKTSETTDTWTLAAVVAGITTVLVFPLMVLEGHGLQDPAAFWLPCFGTVALNLVTTWMRIEGLRDAPHSVALPVLALNPLFVLAVDPFVNGDVPGVLAIFGVTTSVVGVWMLHAQHAQAGVLAPFVALWRTPGIKKILAVALLWAIAAPLDRRAILQATPLVFVAASRAALTIVFCAFAVFRGRGIGRSRMVGVSMLSIAHLLQLCCQMAAFSLAPTTHVITIKRLSALISVVIGRQWFQERERFWQRFVAAAVISAGAIFIGIDRC